MSFGSRKETADEIVKDKEFREAYLWAYLKRSLPFQIRSMRTQRDWSQARAGEILGKPQNVISRLESPAYGKLSLQTLLEIAKGFDVGLLVKFVPYSRLLKENEDVSFDALKASSPTKDFPEELNEIERWSEETDEEGFWVAEAQTNVITSPKFASEPISLQSPPPFTLRFITAVPEATMAPTDKSSNTQAVSQPTHYAANVGRRLAQRR